MRQPEVLDRARLLWQAWAGHWREGSDHGLDSGVIIIWVKRKSKRVGPLLQVQLRRNSVRLDSQTLV